MKILVIRFSSIGDVTQALSVPAHIHSRYPEAKIHFLTKNIFKELLQSNPHIQKIWTVDAHLGLTSLIQFAREINHENFDFIYDAHNNLRSNIFYHIIHSKNKLQKPMQRFKRFLLLNFKINKFEMPFSGQRDLLKPLEKWGIPFSLPLAPQIVLEKDTQLKAQRILTDHHVPENFVACAPSAAHIFKRWPIEKWIELFKSLPQTHFVVLAGTHDTFTHAFNIFPHVTNLTGKTTLLESAAVIAQAQKVVSNDTGLLHFSEQLGKKTIALMGAAPFGFPSRPSTVILKKDVPCWPCSKHGQGPCVNKNYHQCMNDITALEVKKILESL